MRKSFFLLLLSFFFTPYPPYQQLSFLTPPFLNPYIFDFISSSTLLAELIAYSFIHNFIFIYFRSFLFGFHVTLSTPPPIINHNPSNHLAAMPLHYYVLGKVELPFVIIPSAGLVGPFDFLLLNVNGNGYSSGSSSSLLQKHVSINYLLNLQVSSSFPKEALVRNGKGQKNLRQLPSNIILRIQSLPTLLQTSKISN